MFEKVPLEGLSEARYFSAVQSDAASMEGSDVFPGRDSGFYEDNEEEALTIQSEDQDKEI